MAIETTTSTSPPLPGGSGKQSNENVSKPGNTIELPRWIVYCQAALLGVIAATFFIFGLMVGSLTTGQAPPDIAKVDCQVAGKVEYRDGAEIRPDEGAVIFLLPKNERPVERAAASSVNPDGFQALDNPGIEILHHLGGAVVRADENGEFDVVVDGNTNGIDYYFLVVSRHKRNEETSPLTKLQVAAIGTYFIPVERLMDDQAVYWSTVKARADRIEIPRIEFD